MEYQYIKAQNLLACTWWSAKVAIIDDKIITEKFTLKDVKQVAMYYDIAENIPMEEIENLEIEGIGVISNTLIFKVREAKDNE